jgi:hypothetical protein
VGNEVLDYNTKVEDTHGAVTTGASWKFTAPEKGIYSIIQRNSCLAAYVAGDDVSTVLMKNGADLQFNSVSVVIEATATRHQSFVGASQVRLNAGDYIAIRMACPRAGTLYNNESYSFIEITRIGG